MLQGPSLRYARTHGAEEGDEVAEALRLAREVEALLDRTPSSQSACEAGKEPDSVRSTRIARAMAASLVDELEALHRNDRSGARSEPPRTRGTA